MLIILGRQQITTLLLCTFMFILLGCDQDKTLYEMEDQLSIEITHPSNGDVLDGTIEIRAVIGSTVNIQKMVLLLDGEEFSDSNIAEWKTTFYKDGVHEIRGLIIDADGNEIYSDPVTVTLQNSVQVSQNVIDNSGFNIVNSEWYFWGTYPSTFHSHNNSPYCRFWWHFSYILQPMNIHFETGQQFRLSAMARSWDADKSLGVMRLIYTNEKGLKQSFVINMDVLTEWQKFERIIDPPLEAGAFVEVRVDADNFCLDDVRLNRIK